MSTRLRTARRGLAAVLVALTLPLPAAAAPSAGVDCFVVCLGPGACTARYPKDAEHRGSFCQPRSRDDLTIVPGQKPEHLVNCAGWTVEMPADSRLSGSFRSGRGVERFTVGPGPLAPRVASGLCAGPCCQQTQAAGAQAALAGKGAKAVSVNLAGQPCLLGLPCGSLLLPAPLTGFALDAGLAETARAAQWRVREAVAGGAAFALTVAGGRIEWPAQPLKPGAGYVYELLDAQGQLLAAGGFDVLSARMQQDIEADLAAARREAPALAPLAVVEVLLDNDLQWDAVQPPR